LAVLGAVVSVEGMAALVRSLQHRGRLHAAETRLEGLLDPGEIDRTITVVPHAMAWPPSIGIRDFATVLTPGTMAGLCGPSGCGKTTLIAQMLGLRGAVHGRISLGGVALEDIPPDASRRCFAAALQDAALLSGTVRDNLLLADAAATDDALYAALHDAALDVRVRAMPHGLDSWIGEDGARLSGGERRRLVLARALIRPAPWLLLDEPTEGLDAGTEKLVVQRLRARLRRRGQGAMIVSHRPALLAGCDIVLDMAADAAAWQGRALRSSAA
jgi:ATP-binding cassette subfamily C protein CydC